MPHTPQWEQGVPPTVEPPSMPRWEPQKEQEAQTLENAQRIETLAKHGELHTSTTAPVRKRRCETARLQN